MNKQDKHGARTPGDVVRLLGGKVGKKDNGQVVAMINSSADVLALRGNRLIVISDNFTLTEDGTIIATAGKIGGCTIKNGVLRITNANIAEKLTADKIDTKELKVDVANVTGKMTAEQIDATDLKVDAANITGKMTAEQIDASELEVDAANVTGKVKAEQIDATNLTIQNSEGNYSTHVGSGKISISGPKITETGADFFDVPLMRFRALDGEYYVMCARMSIVDPDPDLIGDEKPLPVGIVFRKGDYTNIT
jgi:hypothetical protein